VTVWLAIDTATDFVGVALHGGARVPDEATVPTRRRHTALLAPLVAAMLERHALAVADLAGVAVAIGPGSYTGLRAGLAFAKGLWVAAGTPVFGVPTLDVLAAPLSAPVVARDAPLWAVMGAGRTRLVAACYPPSPGDWPDPASLEAWTADDLLSAAAPPAWVAGEIADDLRARLEAAGLRVLPAAAGLRRAGWLAELGRARAAGGAPADPARLSPVYLGGA